MTIAIEQKQDINLELKRLKLQQKNLNLQQKNIKYQKIGLLALVFAAGSLLFGAYGILQRNKIYRETNSIELMHEFSRIFGRETRQTLSEIISYDDDINHKNYHCLKFIGKQENPISQNTSNNPCSSEIYITETRSHILNTLNFLERVALIYKSGAADKDMIEDYFKTPVVYYVNQLKPFIESVDGDNENRNWEDIRELVEEWENT